MSVSVPTSRTIKTHFRTTTLPERGLRGRRSAGGWRGPTAAATTNESLNFFTFHESLRLLHRMCFQFALCFLQLFNPLGIFGQSTGLKRRIQFIPDGIHLALKIARISSNGHDGVFL